ncbi:hypothetical protein RI367_003529 [Sorochytrium milnesiophthora]
MCYASTIGSGVEEQQPSGAGEQFAATLVSDIIDATDISQMNLAQSTTEELIRGSTSEVQTVNAQIAARLPELRQQFHGAVAVVGELRSELDRAYARLKQLQAKLDPACVRAAKAQVREEIGRLSDEES